MHRNDFMSLFNIVSRLHNNHARSSNILKDHFLRHLWLKLKKLCTNLFIFTIMRGTSLNSHTYIKPLRTDGHQKHDGRRVFKEILIVLSSRVKCDYWHWYNSGSSWLAELISAGDLICYLVCFDLYRSQRWKMTSSAKWYHISWVLC